MQRGRRLEEQMGWRQIRVLLPPHLRTMKAQELAVRVEGMLAAIPAPPGWVPDVADVARVIGEQ